MQARPTSLLVMGILACVWAGLGLLGGLWGMVAHFIPMGPTNPEMEALKREGLYLFTQFGLGCMGLLGNLLLLAGAILALKLRKAGRTILFAYCVVFVVLSLAMLGIQAGYLNERIFQASLAAMGSGPGTAMGPAFVTILKVTMYVQMAFMFLLMIGWPSYICFVLTRPKVKDAFDGTYMPVQSFPMAPGAGDILRG